MVCLLSGGNNDVSRYGEYVKRNNRETGIALVGIEIGRPTDLTGLLSRMDAAPLDIERIKPDSAEFGYLI